MKKRGRGKTAKQKQCRKCEVYKDMRMFHAATANKDGLKSYCKTCASLSVKEWKRSSSVFAQWQRKYRLLPYKMTQEQYQNLLAEQKGTCAICNLRRLRKGESVLHVDHCHQTGKVRGLLCYVCNTSLGRYERWRTQIDSYLTHWEKQ